MTGSRSSGLWRPPESGRPRTGSAARVAYAVACVLAALALATSGLAYFVVRDVNAIGGSHAIVSGPSIGAQNILLMGLESRRDWNGNVLPNSILRHLHAGSRQGVEFEGVGGNDTNTLILIHIFPGGRQAVGFSIPRDDWVSFAGTAGPQQQGKIDQAYGVSMFYQQARLRQRQPSMSQDRLAFLGNEAGRKAAVDTVEKLTGQHVDHFAEVNLGGFYELAKVFGGVHVCLRHAVRDANSGAHFRAGYQHLDAAQALAFVRQRDGLPNGDLDRTHRQQAFLDSVMHQLRTEGVLNDLGKTRALLSVAKRYVITDAGWNLLDFAAQMRDLTSGDLVFHTLPIKGYGQLDNQDVNLVDTAAIKTIVQAAFTAAPPTAPHVQRKKKRRAHRAATVDVLNGGSTAGLARHVSAAFARAGYKAGQVGDTAYRTATAVSYGPGAAASARRIASLFGVTARRPGRWRPRTCRSCSGRAPRSRRSRRSARPGSTRRQPPRAPARRAARWSRRTASRAWTDRRRPGRGRYPRPARLASDRVELAVRVLVQLDIGDRDVLLQMPHRRCARDQQHVGSQVQRPGERDLGRCAAQPGGRALHMLAAQDRVDPGESRAQREERDEGNASRCALFQQRHRGAVGQVKRVLNARDRGVLQGAQQVLGSDVAQADARDQPGVAGRDHGGELIIEALVKGRVVHQPQVDGGELIHAEAAQVVLDGAPQLPGLAVRQPAS